MQQNKNLIRGKYIFSDIIDVESIVSVFQQFSQLTGSTIALTSHPDGELILKKGWRNICVNFHRTCKQSLENCNTSNLKIAKELSIQEPFIISRCKNGLYDGATPIIIEGVHVANIFTGQVLLEKPDLEFFKSQAKEFGYNQDNYIKELLKVPIVKEEDLKQTLSFLSSIANVIVKQSIDKLKEIEKNDEIINSEKRFRNLFNSIGDCVAVYTIKNDEIIISDFNKAAEKLEGLKKKDIVGKKLIDVFKGVKEFGIYDAIKKVKKTGESINLPIKKYKDDSLLAWRENNLYKLPTGEVIAVYKDVTKDIKLNENLRISEEKYRTLTESLSDCVFTLDLEGRFTFLSSAFETISKYKPEDFIGKKFTEKITPECRAFILDNFKKGIGGEKTPLYEVEYFDANNNKIPIEIRVSSMFDDDGNVIGRIGSFRDISKRKFAEKEVVKLTKAIETTPQSAVITDIKGTVVYANKALLDAGGYSNVEEVLGQTLFEFTDNEGVEKLQNLIMPLLFSGKNWLGEMSVKRKDGSFYFAEIICSLINDGKGNPEYLLAHINDITERKIADNKLKEALVKAKESDRLKSAFLSNMSHEIRTPMNGILGFIDLLNDPDLNDAEKLNYQSIISKSSDRLLNTINALIDISKIEAGQVKITNTEFSITNLLTEVLSFFKHQAEDKSIELSLLPNLTITQDIIYTDNNKLHAVLVNLIKNALKFTNKGNIIFGYLIKEEFIEFFVKDTGIGVPKNRHKAIFNRFEQSDITDSLALEGSGLGLAISKAYIEMLGGKIWLSSKEGVGSVFTFNIPYKKGQNSITKTSKQLTKKNKDLFTDLVILVAEDDQYSSLYLENILANKFKEIIFVETGVDAVEVCKNNSNIDIVLMDIKLPLLNGFEATTEIRKFNTDIIIIAQTAYAEISTKNKALKVGCNDYICKPIKNSDLFDIIKKHL